MMETRTAVGDEWRDNGTGHAAEGYTFLESCRKKALVSLVFPQAASYIEAPFSQKRWKERLKSNWGLSVENHVSARHFKGTLVCTRMWIATRVNLKKRQQTNAKKDKVISSLCVSLSEKQCETGLAKGNCSNFHGSWGSKSKNADKHLICFIGVGGNHKQSFSKDLYIVGLTAVLTCLHIVVHKSSFQISRMA